MPNYTLEWWSKVTSKSGNGGYTKNNQAIINSGGLGTELYIRFGDLIYSENGSYKNNFLQVKTMGSQFDTGDPTKGKGFEAQKWYHFAVSYDAASGTTLLYQNGTVVASLSSSIGQPMNIDQFQMISSGEEYFLVDAGGGNGIFKQLEQAGVPFTGIREMFVTHAHEDHIGAIPYMFKEMQFPLYATPLPLGMISNKFDEHGLKAHKKYFRPVEKRKVYKIGEFEIEWIHITHSIIDASALAITTEAGTIIHTGDFKIDHTPIDGFVTDLNRFSHYGEKGGSPVSPKMRGRLFHKWRRIKSWQVIENSEELPVREKHYLESRLQTFYIMERSLPLRQEPKK